MFPFSRRRASLCPWLSTLSLFQLGCDNQAAKIDPGDGGTGSVAHPCNPEDVAPGEQCVDQVVGRVLDESGAPETDLDVTVCGVRCFRGKSGVDGRFSIAIDSPLDLSEYSVQPHGTPDASSFYYPLEAGQSTIDVGTLRTVKLPRDGDLLVTKLELDGAMPPAQMVTSGELTLQFQEGDLVRISVGDALLGDEGRMFRARELDPEEAIWFGPASPDTRVFALGPFEAEISRADHNLPQVGLRVSNDRNWDVGSEVRVLALGSYLDPKWLTPSVFEEIGVARVSDDGEQVVLLPDDVHAGFRFITWIAFEPR